PVGGAEAVPAMLVQQVLGTLQRVDDGAHQAVLIRRQGRLLGAHRSLLGSGRISAGMPYQRNASKADMAARVLFSADIECPPAMLLCCGSSTRRRGSPSKLDAMAGGPARHSGLPWRRVLRSR